MPNDENSKQQIQVRPRVASVPELRNERHLKAKPNLNDIVEEIMYEVWEDENFARFTDATDDASAVEGSLSIDNSKAAEIIRNHAADSQRGRLVRDAKLATIVKSMNVVLRRHNQSRKQRRFTVGGFLVAPEDGNNE